MKPTGKGKLLYLLALLTLLVLMTACSTNMSFTFNIENGDAITVKLDTGDGYSLKQDGGHFLVYNGEEQILEGLFILEEAYAQYENLGEQPNISVHEDSEKDGNPYLFYEYSDDTTVQNNYVLWINGSHTGVLIGSTYGQEETKAAFDRLTLSVNN